MNRILVVHYSRTGHTDVVARRIAARCHADIERIEERGSREGVIGYLRSAAEAILGLHPPIKRGRHRPGDYDLVIVGTPVWFWSVSSPVRTWLHRHHRSLNKVAVFCTCGGSGHAKVLDDLERLCGHPALARLVLTEQATGQCQQVPAFQRFLLELKRVRSVSDPLPPIQEQAPA
ncbi:flavodoxin family protein [Hydrogenophaga sp. ZJX-1]|uniref:flavodoxin family protein n=1 Tax=Hydrogenophaga sp. ZJX-1 TaxID=3404778 RepID=UPI003B28097A